MDRSVYDEMAALDQRHWWYRGRREVLDALLARLAIPEDARILEVGCGTGHNLEMLSRFGTVDAIEVDPAARAIAASRLGRAVMESPLPELEGVPAHGYDLVAALDVIEHIADDAAALAAIAGRLKPGGRFVMTVPAHQWMWSAHDVVNHHHRRYSKRGLKQLIDGSPMKLERIGYFNSLLFPLAVGQRLAAKVARSQRSDVTMPPGLLNQAFERVFAFERRAIGRLPLPPGLSLFAVASAT